MTAVRENSSREDQSVGQLTIILAADLEKGEYKEYKLPPREDTFVLFVDSETESELRTESTTNGHCNVLVARLNLDRLGLMNQILRSVSQLSTLYVTNIALLRETAASSFSDAHVSQDVEPQTIS